jgi:EAL domain-containing protein (putative c-di-GMP-specific phosphodiesterase class I)
MVDMGHGLGLMVTAEGVETEAERATITSLGCDVMQGYLGSRPLHGKALQDWLDRLPSSDPTQV